MSYGNFIEQNIAPLKATKIGVYSNDEKIGKIDLPSTFKPSNLGEKLYSFGAISDIHLQYDTAQEDFQRALIYLNNNESVAFTCISGDLTTSGKDSELQVFKNYVEQYSPNTPVYACAGNHEGNNSSIESIIETYTGHPLYFSFENQGDIFIFVGCKANASGNLFTTAELQWLYETLEANRNKRCFVFEHVRPQDTCGNAYGIYNFDIWGGTEQTVFESLMSHYKNVILFHGHSHLKFNLQTKDNNANYEHDLFGIHSIHIPSLAVPRTGDASGASSRQEIYADSEGYVIDVYTNHIVLRGRDFVNEKFLPIACYCLDTTLQNVDANTYTDSTGTIDTSSSYSITNKLINCSNSNIAISIAKNGSYQATITPSTNYTMQSITVTMSGIDITSSAVNGNDISISSVTGDIEITASAIINAIDCTGIALNNTDLTFTSADSQTLVATVEPSNTTDTISWETSDSNVATVVNGVITPKNNGNCVITAKCGSQSATCNITVNRSATVVTIEQWNDVKIDRTTGKETANTTTYFASEYIEMKDNYNYEYVLNCDESKVWSIYICYYDENKSFISTSSAVLDQSAIISTSIEKVNNAKYFRLRVYCDSIHRELVKESLTISYS